MHYSGLIEFHFIGYHFVYPAFHCFCFSRWLAATCNLTRWWQSLLAKLGSQMSQARSLPGHNLITLCRAFQFLIHFFSEMTTQRTPQTFSCRAILKNSLYCFSMAYSGLQSSISLNFISSSKWREQFNQIKWTQLSKKLHKNWKDINIKTTLDFNFVTLKIHNPYL